MIGATGTIVNEKQNETRKSVTFKASNVIDFAWTASTEFERYVKSYKSIVGKEIEIEFLIQPENDEIIDRKFSAAFNAIEFLEKNIGEFPYSKLTLVDAPRTSHVGGMEYPQIITYYTPLYTPIEAQRPESTVIHEIVHQYFYAALSSNEVYEAWLDEGVTTYLEEKILDEYYDKPELMFRFIDYYPILGIQFLQFYEIPIIYTLRSLKYEQYAYSLNRYYMNNDLGKIVDTSYQLPNRLSYGVSAYYKPNLFLHTLEGYIGTKGVFEIVSNYYRENKLSLVTSADFIDQLLAYEQTDLSWFIESFIVNNKHYDYKLTSIRKSDENKYKIFVERLGDGVAPIEISLYTYTGVDTLKLDWDGKERWKEFEIESQTEIYAGEIDPNRKNKFDVNFANNSYVTESKYWGSLSMAIRWFFWIQNALLLFGSVG
ncbi:MAG: M1 family aminopeptidase [Melioribacteraceae bacterium]|nr:M1 family aminopeptidase [Melioribacteraceae bacterium]